NGIDLAQDLAAAPTGQEEVERLGRGDQDVGRLADHLLAVACGGVARPHECANLWTVRLLLTGEREDLRERPLPVALNTVRQRTQRGHIDDIRSIAPFPR